MSALEFTAEELERSEIRPRTLSTGEVWSPVTLARDIAEAHGLTLADVMGRSRVGSVASARRALYRALRERGWSYPQIGKFCDRNHSTVKQVLDGADGWPAK